MSYSFFFHFALVYLYLHSFPTRRSSDLPILQRSLVLILLRARRGPSSSFSSSFLPPPWAESPLARWLRACSPQALVPVTTQDRKSTRLNSSHVSISYSVFCLQNKKFIIT